MELSPIDWEKVSEEEASDRTVFIVSKQLLFDIFRFRTQDFNQVDAVQTMRYGCGDGLHYLVIQLKDAAAATALIRTGLCVMNRIYEKVTPFHSTDKMFETIVNIRAPTHYTPIPPENSEENILNALNDDCLGEIFKRINHLSDIVSIGKVCMRFNRIAEKAFTSVLKNKVVNFSELNPDGKVSLMDIEKFMHRFGSSIVSVDLGKEDFDHMSDVINPFFKSMQKYCPNLRTLTLKNENLKDLNIETLFETRPLLSKIKYLKISLKSRSKCSDFISACTELETLIVRTPTEGLVLPEINFPNLNFVRIKSKPILDGFLAHNRQIKILDVTHSAQRVRSIAEHLPNVRELKLELDYQPITDVDANHLKSLKHVNISISSMILDESIANIFRIKGIRSLRLAINRTFDGNTSIYIDLMEHLWNLECVRFDFILTRPMSMDVLKKMLKQAKKLRFLRIMWKRDRTHHFDEKDCNEISEIVENRSNPLKLNIATISYTFGEEGLIKEFYVHVNSPWLTITELFSCD